MHNVRIEIYVIGDDIDDIRITHYLEYVCSNDQCDMWKMQLHWALMFLTTWFTLNMVFIVILDFVLIFKTEHVENNTLEANDR